MSPPPHDAPAPPLLATKLHPPRPRRGTVERRRLTERAAGDLPALTLVSAPAGFGKTTLLAEWIADASDAGRRVAWLSLDAGDNDPAVFWTYLLASLQTAVPAVGEDAAALLQTAQPTTSVASSIVNDLASTTDEVMVVLDDLHVIESTDVHDAVGFLVDHLPPHVHLVVASRTDPPLPLARLRARGDLLEVRAADLRFTADEATTYFNESMGLSLTPADVDALAARTEGWAAALQLAALSMQGRDDLDAFVAEFAGDDRFVVDYLAEEVLDHQPDDVRRFLLDTAILDRFTGELCDAVTGGHDGRAMLDRLDRANLFLVALDDRRQWYRYHHLVADVLRVRLLDGDPAHVDALHRSASAWYEEHGEQGEAIAHALAGHDPERAARLVELAAPALFQARQEWTARRWLSALPAELYRDRPVLSVELAGARMISGDVEGVGALLDDIEGWLDPGVDASAAVVFDHEHFARLPAQVAIYRAALALIAGDTGATIEQAGRALELAGPDDHLQRGSAAALVGLAEWAGGDIDAAVHHYTAAIDALTAAGHISDVLGCSIALADMRLVQGRSGDAQRALDAGLRLAEAHHVARGPADMHVGLSEVLLERNDLDGARRHLDADALLGEQAGLPQHAYRWRVAKARLLLVEGDHPTALALLDEAERHYNTDMSPPVRPVAAVRARALLTAGDLAAARSWVGGRRLTVDDELDYVREYEHITLARVLLAADSTDDARRLLERLLTAAEEGGRSGSAVEILVLLAVARSRGGDDAGATDALEEALVRAEPDGRPRVFLDELPALASLLRAIPASSAARPLADRVLTTGAPDREPLARSGQGLVDPLSDRELEVLHLLRGDQSGPEIARSLHVSLNTLRTHTKRIFTKLGVNNRREAVRRAAELGL